MAILLEKQIQLSRCPHCNIANPFLDTKAYLETKNGNGGNGRLWHFYVCSKCGGVITASAPKGGGFISRIFPANTIVDDAIPEKAKTFLQQAVESIHAPAGALMLAASAIDAMLKNRGYKEGSLFTRINKTVEDHILTSDMAEWAHEIRLDANDQRHADEDMPLPKEIDAMKCIDFAMTLGQILFVLPAMVKRGIETTKSSSK